MSDKPRALQNDDHRDEHDDHLGDEAERMRRRNQVDQVDDEGGDQNNDQREDENVHCAISCVYPAATADAPLSLGLRAEVFEDVVRRVRAADSLKRKKAAR